MVMIDVVEMNGFAVVDSVEVSSSIMEVLEALTSDLEAKFGSNQSHYL